MPSVTDHHGFCCGKIALLRLFQCRIPRLRACPELMISPITTSSSSQLPFAYREYYRDPSYIVPLYLTGTITRTGID